MSKHYSFQNLCHVVLYGNNFHLNSYWRNIETKKLKALCRPAGWLADRPNRIAAVEWEMVQECVKWQETLDTDRAGEREGELERCWNEDDVRGCMKRGKRGDPWRRVWVGVAHKDREYQEAEWNKENRDVTVEKWRLEMKDSKIVQCQAQSGSKEIKEKAGRGKRPTEMEEVRVRDSQRQMSPSLFSADW